MSPTHRRWSHLMLIAIMVSSLNFTYVPASAQSGMTFIVTTTVDLSGSTCENPCSLRQAIAASQANPGSTIAFDIEQNDPGYNEESIAPTLVRTWTITPNSPLPFVTADGTIIDGRTQAANFGGNPNIFGPEIIIDGSNVTDTGGLTLISNDNQVLGLGIVNFQGTNLKGIGIEVRGTGNTIQGNYVGVDKTGSIAAGNNDAGIWLRGDNNTVGGDSTFQTGEFNVISGNTRDGVLVEGNNNFVRGNYIGTDARGLTAVANGGSGVQVRINANGNTIGTGPDDANAVFRNLIAGNGEYGVLIRDASENNVYGNFIGLDDTGNTKLPNGFGGIQIIATGASTSNNIVGGTSRFSRNYIAGNNGPGIHITGPFASGNTVANNYIGLGRNSAVPQGETLNQTFGVLIDRGASENTVGGSIETSQNNVISGNEGDGIHVLGAFNPPITDENSDGNIISGNYIGTNTAGNAAIPNAGDGIEVTTNVSGTVIGGTTTEERNLIGHNTGDGILINATSANVLSTTIRKNMVFANQGNGIRVFNADGTVIDGIDEESPNLITDNGIHGVFFIAADASILRYNTIRENIRSGLSAFEATNSTVEFNTVNRNGEYGIEFKEDSALGNITTNTIYTNTLEGMFVSGSQDINILDNSISGNGGIGINLDPTGPPPGVATNANHDIDPPFDISINQEGLISGLVITDTNAPAACLNCAIQIFTSNPETRDAQGRDFVTETTTDADGVFQAELGRVPVDGNQIVLTATDDEGDEQRNTSEFAVLDVVRSVLIEPDRIGEPPQIAPTQVYTYFHTVTNNGTVDDTFSLSGESSLDWDFIIEPADEFDLPAGETQAVTVTVTAPTGSDPRVRAGLDHRLTVTVTSTSNESITDTALDTTTVAAQIVLSIEPPAQEGVTQAGTQLDYAHTIRNDGNIVATIDLSLDTSDVPPTWTTTLSGNTFTIEPGESVQPVLSVTPAEGTLAGVSATTLINLGVREDPSLNTVITDTTTIVTTPDVFILPTGISFDGAAGKVTIFEHTITNISNGPVDVVLVGSSSLGSEVTFESLTPGIEFDGNNRVTIPRTEGDNVFSLAVNVLVPDDAGIGQRDTVTIQVVDATDGVVLASTQDFIEVVRGLFRLRLPFAAR